MESIFKTFNFSSRIKPVLFSDYDSLEKILKIALGMYEDFKQELIPIYS